MTNYATGQFFRGVRRLLGHCCHCNAGILPASAGWKPALLWVAGRTVALALALVLVPLSQLARAASAPSTLPQALPKHVTPATQKAIDAGLAYLVRTQGPDGAWRSNGSTASTP